MIDQEQFYDNEIAPLLAQVAEKCHAAGLPLLCTVQYNDDAVADTMNLMPDMALELYTACICLRTGRNIDSMFIGLAKFCKEHGLDKNSLFLKALDQ